MAREFLRAGRRVVVCERGLEGVEEAVAALGAEHGKLVLVVAERRSIKSAESVSAGEVPGGTAA